MTKVEGETMPGMMGGKSVSILPTFSLSEKDLPEMKDWKVGDKYTLVIEVEMTKMMQGSEYPMYGTPPDKTIKGNFKVTSVAVEENDDSETPSKDPKSSDAYEMEYAKRMSGKK